MKTFLTNLLSRKFLLALGAFLTCAANKQWPEAMGIVMAYIGVEGAADFRDRG